LTSNCMALPATTGHYTLRGDTMPEGDERLAYSVEEVAKRLGLTERAVRQLVKSGQLRAVRAGRLYRIPADAVTEFLSGGKREE
jgi:excisionase family DNA binding protein